MASTFCPTCGTRRVGAFRYCRSCQFDFDSLDVARAVGVPVAPPDSFEMVAPLEAPAAATATPTGQTSALETSASVVTGSGAAAPLSAPSGVEVVVFRAIAAIMVVFMIVAFILVITGTLSATP